MEPTNMYVYVAALLVILGVFALKNYVRAVILAFKLLGPKAVPVLGNVHYLTDEKELLNSDSKVHNVYGAITRVWLSILPCFLITEPEYLKILLSTTKFVDKNLFYNLLSSFLGDGLIISTGQKWKSNRKCMQGNFNMNLLKVFYTSIHEHSVKMVSQLKEDTDFNVTRILRKYVLDVAFDTVFGMETDENSPFSGGKPTILYRVSRPWLLFDKLFSLTNAANSDEKQIMKVKDYTRQILEKKKQNNNNGPSRINFLDLMMETAEADPSFTEDDIVNEAGTLVLASQDTVGAGISFTLYHLAKHQDIQEKVFEELNSIFDGSDRSTTFEDLSEMRYLEQCVKETLRLVPGIAMISRKLTQDVTLGKVTLPEGSNIFVSPYLTQRLPKYFPNPTEFNPDRWSPQNQKNIHPYSYLPFGAGPRICIGNKFGTIEIKSIISEILRNFHVSLCTGKEDLNLAFRVIIRAKGGIWLRLKRRNFQ